MMDYIDIAVRAESHFRKDELEECCKLLRLLSPAQLGYICAFVYSVLIIQHKKHAAKWYSFLKEQISKDMNEYHVYWDEEILIFTGRDAQEAFDNASPEYKEKAKSFENLTWVGYGIVQGGASHCSFFPNYHEQQTSS